MQLKDCFVAGFLIVVLASAAEPSLAIDAAADTVDQLGHIKVAVQGFLKCVVCNKPLRHDSTAYALLYHGRKIPVHSFCESTARSNPSIYKNYFAALQPRGALFQERDRRSNGFDIGWLIFGVTVLLALLAGGCSGYIAISRGLPALQSFFIGLTIIGFFYVVTRPSAGSPGEAPEGLVKIPTTSAPLACDKCGYPNHPSAKSCAACGTALAPKTESEVKRVN